LKAPIAVHRPGPLRGPGAGRAKSRGLLPRPSPLAPRPVEHSTTNFLTATTLIYAIGAGITAAAGTRLALQLILVNLFTLYSFKLRVAVRPPVFILHFTTSPDGYWVICAPAAFLRSGSRL